MHPWQYFGYSDEESYDDFINRWAESEKNKYEVIGEHQAISELSRQAYLDNGKSEKIGKSEKGIRYLWITVNPKPTVSIDTFVKTIKKMYSKKWITSYAYVFENTSNGHVHSHGLIACDYEFARSKKELGNSVSSVCDINNSHCFKVVLVSEDIAKSKFEYMSGLKQSKKLDDVVLTKEWRTENKLQDMYFSTEPLTLLGSEGKEKDS